MLAANFDTAKVIIVAHSANFYEFLGRIMFYIVCFLNKHDVVHLMIIV